MTHSPPSTKGSTVQLAGLHKPIRRHANGVTLHVYAWRGRGAPKLGTYHGDTPAAAHRACAADSRGIADRYAATSMLSPSAKYIAGLINEYKSSSDWAGMSDSTQRNWRPWLDRIAEVWGDQRVSIMSVTGARRRLIMWRDYYAERRGKRAGDYGMQVMSRLLSFAVDREYLQRNPAKGIAKVYKQNRAALIWTDEQIADLVAVAPAHVGYAVELAALTGLRLSDLVTLRWDELEPGKRTSKSRGRRVALIPLTAALRALLARIPRQGDVIITNAYAQPWARANALSQAIKAAAKKAGITELHAHDLRGTAATRYAVAGLSDRDIADCMGWDLKSISAVRAMYVDQGATRRRIADMVEAFTPTDSPDAETRA